MNTRFSISPQSLQLTLCRSKFGCQRCVSGSSVCATMQLCWCPSMQAISQDAHRLSAGCQQLLQELRLQQAGWETALTNTVSIMRSAHVSCWSCYTAHLLTAEPSRNTLKHSVGFYRARMRPGPVTSYCWTGEPPLHMSSAVHVSVAWLQLLQTGGGLEEDTLVPSSGTDCVFKST